MRIFPTSARVPLIGAALVAALPCRTAMAQTADAGTAPAEPVETTLTATQDEVNVATTTQGATGLGDVPGLNDVLAGKPDAAAQFTPSAEGAALGVIDLAGTANLSRVQLQVGEAPGRIVLLGLNEAGQLVDLNTPEGAGLLIADRKLDGSETNLSFDVSKLTVKAVMIYWVPDEPGTPLVVNQLGIFTRETFVPDPVKPPVAALQAPIVPAPEVVRTVINSLVAGSTLNTAPATGTTTNTATTSTLPSMTVELSKAVSL